MTMNYKIILPFLTVLLVSMLPTLVQGKRIYMSWWTQSLPMMISSRCGVFTDDQKFGSKGCPEVDLVGNWANMDLDKEKCSTGCGWTACMKGPVCTIKNAFGASIYSVECNPQGSSTPGPNNIGFITTEDCANEKHIYG